VKVLTREQAQARKDKAIRFVEDVLQDPDHADSIRDEDLEDWAERKHIRISNPPRSGSNMTKQEALDVLDEVQDILEDAYDPQSSREDLAKAIGDALDALDPQNGGEDDDDDGDDDSVDEDDNGK
jgi:hypothetical protein